MKEITIKIPDFSARNLAILILLLMGGAVGYWQYSSRPTRRAPVNQKRNSEQAAKESGHARQEEGSEHRPEEGESSLGGKIILKPEAQQTAQIQTMEVEPRRLQKWLDATGVVDPDLNRVARVRPLARGVVRQVHVRLGDRVKAGQVLFEYDNIEMGELVGEYKTLLSQRAKLEAHAKVTEQAAERARQLLSAQALAQKEVELRIAEHREAQAELEARVAGLNAVVRKLHRFGWKQEELTAPSTDNPSVQSVTAPQEGVILDFKVAPGEVVAAEQDVMTVANVRHVWVTARVYEKDLGRVRTGQTAEISFISFPGRRFSGRITQIGSRLDPETRTAMVRVEVDNSGELLKLEMFGTVRLPTQDSRLALAVPENAVQQIDGKDAVFIQAGTNEFAKREVRLGPEVGGWVEIMSGLKAGEKVITQGGFMLKSELKKQEFGEKEH